MFTINQSSNFKLPENICKVKTRKSRSAREER